MNKHKYLKLLNLKNIFFLISIVVFVACNDVTNLQNSRESNPDLDSNRLVIYSGRSESLVSNLIDEFAEEYNITVEVRYASSTELAGVLALEGNKSPADLFYSQDPISLGYVSSENLFFKLPDYVLSKGNVLGNDVNSYWVGISGRVRSLVVDTSVVNPGDIPSDIYGLANEKFRNKIGLAPTNSSFIAMVACMIYEDGELKVSDWLNQIHNLNYLEFINNSTQVSAVDLGELDIGLVNHYYTLRLLAEKGISPAQNVYLENGCGVLVMPSGIGILESSKNKKAALQFIEFLQSKRVQEYITNTVFEFPLVEGVVTNILLPDLNSLNSPKNLDWSELSLLQDKAIELIIKAGF